MKKFFSFVSLVCLLNMLAIGGVAGFLFGTGRLDKAKAQTIADILTRPGTPVGFREKIGDLLKAPTSGAPATGPATHPALLGDAAELREGEAPPASAEERIAFLRRVQEEERLRTQGIEQSLRQQQELLARKEAALQDERTKIEREKDALQKQLASSSSRTVDEGFTRTMALFDELKPAQIKDLLVPMGSDEAARYLGAMDPDQAARIIGEFKTADEKAFVTSMMERLRAGGPAAGTGAASGSSTRPATTMTAAATPAKAGP